jgi:dienelactone hydrolase
VARILLLHSTYGLRPAVRDAAERLRAAGHEVHVPDLFDGRTAESAEEGQAIRDGIGNDELLRRAVTAAAPCSENGLVYAGFSLGGALAQNLALADEKARGLLLFHGTSDLRDEAVAADLPVQLHVAEPDPFETEDWLNAWYLRMRRAGAEAADRAWASALAFLTETDQA